jgi:hypothetical protein
LVGGLDDRVGLVDPGGERLVRDREELLAHELVQRAEQLVRPPALIVPAYDDLLDSQIPKYPPTVRRVSAQQGTPVLAERPQGREVLGAGDAACGLLLGIQGV